MFGIPFDRYFKDELADLEKLAGLGLVRLNSHGLTVTPKGRFYPQHRHGVRSPPAP